MEGGKRKFQDGTKTRRPVNIIVYLKRNKVRKIQTKRLKTIKVLQKYIYTNPRNFKKINLADNKGLWLLYFLNLI